RVVVPALEALGAPRLWLAVSTHPHPDHLGGLAAAVAWGRPERLWLPDSFRDDPRYEGLLRAASGTRTRVEWVPAAGARDDSTGAVLEARWTPAPGENDRSLVV
ncbi:MAG: ComEC/Rec2 family competence protein, partial [Deferrisomatales bacterium]